jgi:hypothetical protein
VLKNKGFVHHINEPIFEQGTTSINFGFEGSPIDALALDRSRAEL